MVAVHGCRFTGSGFFQLFNRKPATANCSLPTANCQLFSLLHPHAPVKHPPFFPLLTKHFNISNGRAEILGLRIVRMAHDFRWIDHFRIHDARGRHTGYPW